MGFPFAVRSGMKNTHLHVKEGTFKPVNIDIPLLGKTLLCNMLCSQFDTNLTLIPGAE